MGSLYSMTGFAQAASKNSPDVVIELKSVNSRFLDINCKLPNGAEKYEPAIQKLIRSKLSRGRVEVLLKREVERSSSSAVNFNAVLFNSAVESVVSQLSLKNLELKDQVKLVASLLLERKEFLSFEQTDLSASITEEAVLEALNTALLSLCSMRSVEGENLKKVLEDNLSQIKQFPSKVKPLLSAAKSKYTARLKNKIAELELTIPEDRLALEVALVVDRSDVAEELDRLTSHVQQFGQLLAAGGEVGKKLDFLTQEMNREINTTGSKSQSAEISNLVIDAKSVLEKIREQVQNIE
jgi:uncharacterized protein (TIGR00255 family)